MKKPEVQAIKMKYSDIMSFEFSNTMHKIASKDTSNKNACHIAKIVKLCQEARNNAMKDFQKNVAEVFGKRDEAGKLIRPEGQDQGFEPMDGKEEEIFKAQELLGETEFEVKWKPLTPSVLADVKLSAKDIDALKNLFSEEEPAPVGPGLPNFPGVPA